MSPALGHESLLSDPGASLRTVLFSSFVILQTLLNVGSSFIGPVGTFYLLFDYLSSGPYEWYSGPVLGVVLGSPFGTSILTLLLVPVGMPEALEWGKFHTLSPREATRLARFLPFCGRHPIWRIAILRHLMLGLQIGVLVWAPALVVARNALGPQLSTWQQIIGGACYITLLAVPIVPLGLLGFAVEENAERVVASMSDHPSVCCRAMLRVGGSLRLLFSSGREPAEGSDVRASRSTINVA
jgi:hypothetical protein